MERAKIYTQAYQGMAAKPLIIKRAMALEATLKSMSIFIDDGELLVGNHACKPKAAPIFPEYAVAWLIDEIDTFDKRSGDAFYLTENDKKEILEICRYWTGKTVDEKGDELMTEEMREIHATELIRAEANLTSGDGHIAVNFEKLLEWGIKGYLQWVKEMREKLDLTDWADLRKEQFYKAIEISLKGVSAFMGRFAALARDQVADEVDPARKKELAAIRENCERIALDPPENFYQALQLTYFIQLILQIESNGHSVSLGRLDQYLYPFYVRDMERGALDSDKALELLESMWLKLLAINKIRPWGHTRYSAGSPLYQNVTIGGQTQSGEDAVNELTHLILHSVGELKLPQPNLSVRYHKNASEDFMMKCIQVIEKGFGMPAFMNDEIIVPSLIGLGVAPEDAYNYSAIGCVEVAVPGKWGYRCTGMSFLNLMRVFLATLNNGYDPYSGKTFCLGCGNLESFDTFEELMNAWKKQIQFYTKATVMIDTAIDTALEENVPDVICSAFVDECIERGKTLKEGGAKYDFISGLQVGIANLANSLAAVKKLVFEEKIISKADLMKVLSDNFEETEGENLRQLIINRAPKYGNDDDSVDLLLHDAYMIFIEELTKYHNTRYGRGPIGGKYYAGTSSIAANIPSGALLTATPDGRKAHKPLAEGSSPSSGTDRLGPTAVFKSISKLPTDRIVGGVLLNQKLSPSAIRTEHDKMKLISIIRTFFDELKGFHVQYNIVSKQTLLAAKAKPEEYRDLVVRVAGYSAFFTILSPETQDDIIARTEHAL